MTHERAELAPRLSERLSALADMIPPCASVADVGADHGYASARLLELGRCRFVYVTDISDKALSRGKANLLRLGFADRAMFVVGDGLSALREACEPIDAIMIAGMGAQTIVDILDNGYEQLVKLEYPILALSPNRDPELVRYWLAAHHYHVIHERVVRSAGRWYPVMRAEYGDDSADVTDRRALYLGLTGRKPLGDDARAYWVWRLGVLQAMRPGTRKQSADGFGTLEEKIQWVDESLS